MLGRTSSSAQPLHPSRSEDSPAQPSSPSSTSAGTGEQSGPGPASLLATSSRLSRTADEARALIEEAQAAVTAALPRLVPVNGRPAQDDAARIARERVEALDALRDLCSWVRKTPGFVPDELRRAERVLRHCTGSEPARPRRVATLHGVAYWLMDEGEGRDEHGAAVDALYARPEGWQTPPVRVCGGHVAMRNLDRIAESRAALSNILRAHGVTVPAWAEV